MKKLRFAALVLALATSPVFGQVDNQVSVIQESRSMSQGTQNAFVVQLPNTKKKEIEKAWENYAETFKGKTRFDKKNGEFFTDDALIKSISTNTVDVFAKITEISNGTELAVWFNVGLDYLSSDKYPQNYRAADEILRKFAISVAADGLEDELKEQEKQQRTLEDNLKKLEKEKASRQKDIQEYQETIRKAQDNIKKAEDDIKNNEKAQEDKRKEIETQKKIVQETQAKLKKLRDK